MREKKEKETEEKQFLRLMEIIRRDPEKGLRLFYEAYGKIVQTTAQVICRCSSDKVEEVIDDVFVKIWEYSKSGGQVDNPGGWIYTVTANAARQATRAQYVLPLEEEFATTEDLMEEVIDKQSFYWMLEGLSEVEQAVMIYKFVARDTFQEIAEKFGKPLTTITSVYYRSFDKIKKKLEEKK